MTARTIILAMTLDEALALGRVLIETNADSCVEELEMTPQQAVLVDAVFDQLDTELSEEFPDWGADFFEEAE